MTRLAVALAAVALLALAPTATGAPPTITYSCSPGPADCFAWHRTDVTLVFTVSGSSLVSVSGCQTRTITADTAGASYTCTATNSQNESSSVTVVVRRDATPPSVTGATASRAADANGWYRAPFSVSFTGADALSGLASCSAATYAEPDTAAGVIQGTCTDLAGNTSAPTPFAFRFDATPPQVTGVSLARRPDSGDWYTRPVGVAFVGADAVSGVASCTTVEYAGPDDGAARVTGSCSDRAGNVSGDHAAAFKYDATPPEPPAVNVERERAVVTLRWQASADTTSVQVDRTPGRAGRGASTVFRGTASSFRDAGLPRNRTYRYIVTAADEAGNRAARTVSVFVRPALFRPEPGATVRRAPLLAWEPDPRATYYNVQLHRGGRKILTLWPAKPQLRLPDAWTSEGRSERLLPGRYTWYVWPGYGSRAQTRYGPRLGSSSFVLKR